MAELRVGIRALAGMYRAGLRSVLAYRGDLFIGIVGMIISTALTITVWRVVYGGRAEVAGISESTAVAYAVLAAAVQTVIMPWQFSSLQQRVRLGQVGVDLTRPYGLISQTLAQQVGVLVARLPIGLAGIAIGVVLGAVRLPTGPVAAALFVVSLTLGVANVLLMRTSCRAP